MNAKLRRWCLGVLVPAAAFLGGRAYVADDDGGLLTAGAGHPT